MKKAKKTAMPSTRADDNPRGRKFVELYEKLDVACWGYLEATVIFALAELLEDSVTNYMKYHNRCSECLEMAHQRMGEIIDIAFNKELGSFEKVNALAQARASAKNVN